MLWRGPPLPAYEKFVESGSPQGETNPHVAVRGEELRSIFILYTEDSNFGLWAEQGLCLVRTS